MTKTESERFKKLVEQAMREVHKNMPSTCPNGGCSEEQLRAIAFAKARKLSKLWKEKPKPTNAKVFS